MTAATQHAPPDADRVSRAFAPWIAASTRRLQQLHGLELEEAVAQVAEAHAPRRKEGNTIGLA